VNLYEKRFSYRGQRNCNNPVKGQVAANGWFILG